jgi:MFS family permease
LRRSAGHPSHQNPLPILKTAQTIEWLISARALAGIGGGGIVSCVWVLTAQLVPETSRAKWSQALSITWCSSAVSGPLLGGVFSGWWHDLLPSARLTIWPPLGELGTVLNWRWSCASVCASVLYCQTDVESAVYINLPICFCAVVIMALSLYHIPLNATTKTTWQGFISTFDFIGLFVSFLPFMTLS